jgi:protein-S-isoprenylcysteine O-methyltransferase Ste14
VTDTPSLPDEGRGGARRRDPIGLLLVAVQMAAFVALVVLPATPSFPNPTAVRTLGGAMAIAGLALALWAALALGRRLTPLPQPRPDSDLVTSGPFAIARHPIYLGIGVAALGYSLVTGGWWHLAVAVALCALFAVKSGYEGRALQRAFPDYAAYAERVPAFGLRLPGRRAAR